MHWSWWRRAAAMTVGLPWYLNLVANPDVTVRLRDRPPVPMRAVVADAQQRARLWPEVIKDHTNYADYQRRTEREIPLVLLRPAGDD